MRSEVHTFFPATEAIAVAVSEGQRVHAGADALAEVREIR